MRLVSVQHSRSITYLMVLKKAERNVLDIFAVLEAGITGIKSKFNDVLRERSFFPRIKLSPFRQFVGFLILNLHAITALIKIC